MIRAALLLALSAAPAGASALGFRCGLTEAPSGGAFAGPIALTLHPDKGKASVADPLTRYYTGGPVAATLARQGQGWRIDWQIEGVQEAGAAPRTLRYRADLLDGALKLSAREDGTGVTRHARGECWPKQAG